MQINNLIKYLEVLKETGIDFLPSKNIKNSKDNKKKLLKLIQQQVENCKKCNISKSKKNYVFGEGNINAKLMFIGEAPGAQEDIQGKPFVGEAGKLLTKIIKAMNLKREDVYIANILKCRPPNNREPQKNEIENCYPFLKNQIKIIKPEIICALGKISAQTLLNTKEPISKIRGKIFNYYDNIKLIPTYHPSHLLHHPENKKYVWKDMQLIMKLLKL